MTELVRICHRVVSVSLWGLLLVVVASLIAADETAGQETHRAALIVQFGDGTTQSSCVSFPEDQISGVDLLRRSGLAVVFSGFGGLGSGVCQIDGEGCSNPGDCFCQCRGGDCEYWSYWTLEDGAWRFQPTGASQRQLRNGDADVWVWGDRSTPPDPATFGDVCPLVLPTNPPPARPPSNDGGDNNPDPPAGGPGIQPGVQQGVQPTSAGDPPPMPGEDVARPTSRATEQARRAIATPRPEASGATGVSGEDDGSGGAPVGIIAFGATVGVLSLGIAGLVLRRRLVG